MWNFAVSVYIKFMLFNSWFLRDRPKHPYTIHVWAGIGLHGRTGICIFTGTMDWYLFVNILEKTLVPFVKDVYPDSHRFMADNDPKHNSLYGRDFLTAQNIKWWRYLAKSPDFNPNENVWHKLKEYIWSEVKPTRKEELVQGILQFGRQLTWPSVQNIFATCVKSFLN